MVERRALDLYTLHRVVQIEGKFLNQQLITNCIPFIFKVDLKMQLKNENGPKCHKEWVIKLVKVLVRYLKLIMKDFFFHLMFSKQAKLLMWYVNFTENNFSVIITFSFQKLEENNAEDIEKADKDYKPHGIVSRMQIKPPPEKNARRSKRFDNNDESKTEVSIFTVKFF